MFVLLTALFTVDACLRVIVNHSYKTERISLTLYCQLRVFFKVADLVLRNIILLLLSCATVITTSVWWASFKCWGILPVFVSFSTCLIAIIITVLLVVFLPRAVKICDDSQKLINHKKATYHTYDRYNRNRYYFLLWTAQRMLPIRFGHQFVISYQTPINYFSVLMTCLTNACLLVSPWLNLEKVESMNFRDRSKRILGVMKL